MRFLSFHIAVISFIIAILIIQCHGTRLHQEEEEELEEEGRYVPDLPRISRKAKWEMIRSSGQDPSHRRRTKKMRRTRRVLPPWRRHNPLRAVPLRPTVPPEPSKVATCPRFFDAVTRGPHGRTYLFSGDRVYQTWIEDGLPQRAAYSLSEMFSGGPPLVTAASTNPRSGVTTLFFGRSSYRFRWNEEAKRFHLAHNSPRLLNGNITMIPQMAFEWRGHQVLINGAQFVTYDAYWNIATFSAKTATYFPELSPDIVGVYLDRGTTVFFFTRRNTIQVYDRKKHRRVLEFPLRINEMAGCF